MQDILGPHIKLPPRTLQLSSPCRPAGNVVIGPLLGCAAAVCGHLYSKADTCTTPVWEVLCVPAGVWWTSS